jgi:glutathione S-transferase
MKLYYHPVSSYSQKVLMAFHEKGVRFTPEVVQLMDPAARAKYQELSPMGKIPLLVLDDGWKIPESTIIIEYLEGHHPSGTRLIPEDKDKARQARFADRLADLYVNDPCSTIIRDSFRPEAERNPKAVAEARETLEKSLPGLDRYLEGRTWANGADFSIGDCALAPPLFYCRKVFPFDRWKHVTAYFSRVSERPSFQKVQAEAAPMLAAMQAQMQQRK